MHKTTKRILLGCTIAALYFLGAAMGSRHTAVRAANSGPSVTIGSPIPLPVSGAVTVPLTTRAGVDQSLTGRGWTRQTSLSGTSN